MLMFPPYANENAPQINEFAPQKSGNRGAPYTTFHTKTSLASRFLERCTQGARSRFSLFELDL